MLLGQRSDESSGGIQIGGNHDGAGDDVSLDLLQLSDDGIINNNVGAFADVVHTVLLQTGRNGTGNQLAVTGSEDVVADDVVQGTDTGNQNMIGSDAALVGVSTDDLGKVAGVVENEEKMSKVLSDFEFKVMTMYMDGMTCAEICEATGKSAKSVDNALQRSKRKLLGIILK